MPQATKAVGWPVSIPTSGILLFIPYDAERGLWVSQRLNPDERDSLIYTLLTIMLMLVLVGNRLNPDERDSLIYTADIPCTRSITGAYESQSRRAGFSYLYSRSWKVNTQFSGSLSSQSRRAGFSYLYCIRFNQIDC